MTARNAGRLCPLSLTEEADFQCSEQTTSGTIWHLLLWKTPESGSKIQVRIKQPDQRLTYATLRGVMFNPAEKKQKQPTPALNESQQGGYCL